MSSGITELQVLQWSLGVMGTLLVSFLSVAVWVIWRLQKIPSIVKRQNEQSEKVERISVFLVRVDERLRRTELDVKEILKYCRRAQMDEHEHKFHHRVETD